MSVCAQTCRISTIKENMSQEHCGHFLFLIQQTIAYKYPPFFSRAKSCPLYRKINNLLAAHPLLIREIVLTEFYWVVGLFACCWLVFF